MKRICVISLLFSLVASTAFADISNDECSGPTITVGMVQACNQGQQVSVPITISDTAGKTYKLSNTLKI
jgi:hypothetical protein